MNKTIDINLANILFHIDENAYNKLRQYLEAIRRSFAGTPGCEEIVADVEARIAELFSEKLENDRQVITEKQVDEVISVMGQPEDYMVDEDIFEDTPPRRTRPGRNKKLYRDTDNKYVGGVCAGLEHYLAIDVVWIRILFVILALFTGFGFIAYILLWILVPEASTTAQKLDMRGEPVNISNIERKVKEGFDEVADRVKNVDYEKVGDRVKRGSRSFFDALADIFLFIFKIIAKLVGILMIVIGAVTLIGLFIGFFTVGVLDIIHIPGIDFYELALSRDIPIWVISLLCFFAIGIPFFFLLYLGLKILVNNLKSIGRVAKFSLLGIWLVSVVGLFVIGINQATAHAFNGRVTETSILERAPGPDTLMIRFQEKSIYDSGDRVFEGFDDTEVIYGPDGTALIYSEQVRLDLERSPDSLYRLVVRKSADGASFMEAKDRAGRIQYDFELDGNDLNLNSYLTAATSDKMRDQEVRLVLQVPEGSVIRFDASGRNLGYRTEFSGDYYRSDIVEHSWKMGEDGELECLDCTEDSGETENELRVDEEGVRINLQHQEDSFRLEVNEEGVRVKVED